MTLLNIEPPHEEVLYEEFNLFTTGQPSHGRKGMQWRESNREYTGPNLKLLLEQEVEARPHGAIE